MLKLIFKSTGHRIWLANPGYPMSLLQNTTSYHNNNVFCLILPLIHFKLIFCNWFLVDEPKSHVYFVWAYENPSHSMAFVGTKDVEFFVVFALDSLINFSPKEETVIWDSNDIFAYFLFQFVQIAFMFYAFRLDDFPIYLFRILREKIAWKLDVVDTRST